MAGFKKVSSILALLIELLDPAIMASLRMRVFPSLCRRPHLRKARARKSVLQRALVRRLLQERRLRPSRLPAHPRRDISL